MSTLDALLNAIVADPGEDTRWLVLADWLDEFDDPRRAELLRLHRRLIATCTDPDAHPERGAWQARVVELLVAGVRPVGPRHTVDLPGGVPMTFAFIPPGVFVMGSRRLAGPIIPQRDESPAHRVTLSRGFFLGTHPVTQAQWDAVMGGNACAFPGKTRPVENVSWDDCQEFCARVNKSLAGGTVALPTEAQWEYACRAGTTTAFSFGDVPDADLMNYDGNCTWNGSSKGKYRRKTSAVGLLPPNAWGLFDTHGNVWEWCSDWYATYKSGAQRDPTGPKRGTERVLRGGCWDAIPEYCRAAKRLGYGSMTHDNKSGFRVRFDPK